MQPSFDLRIRTMIKAMNEVVIPAVDSDNQAALDQARLVAASLDMLIEQIDYAHWFEIADIQLMNRMISALTEITPTETADLAKAVAVTAMQAASRHEVSLPEIREHTRLLRDRISDLIESVGMLNDPKKLAQANEIILKLSQPQLNRERAFFAKTGFDTSPETLKSIREALEQKD